ncbi:MAG TPA: DUF932 domain-containing protein [Vicinamibacterales bacterium]|nr:DUF932 domain-containing protein [Vicinamibacterales bacterium]
MAHEIENMMFVGETPWHGLGTALQTAPESIAEALKLAGLDWSVRLEQLQLADGTAVDRYATIRSSDNRVLGTVGCGYRPVQNADAFQFFAPFVEQRAVSIETAGSLRKGARVWMLAKIAREDSVIVPKAGDRVAKYLLVANGHDGSLALHVGLTPIRVVCQNTLSASIADRRTATIKIRHTAKSGDALKLVQETIDRVDHDFEKAAEVFRALASVNVTEASLRTFVDRVFRRVKAKRDAAIAAAQSAVEGDSFDALMSRDFVSAGSTLTTTKERESRVFETVSQLFESGRGNDAPGVRGTAWAAYNAATEYLTWQRGNDNDTRLSNAWFGDVSDRTLAAAAQTFLAS